MQNSPLPSSSLCHPHRQSSFSLSYKQTSGVYKPTESIAIDNMNQLKEWQDGMGGCGVLLYVFG